MNERVGVPRSKIEDLIEDGIHKIFRANTTIGVITLATSALEEISDEISHSIGTSVRQHHPGENQLVLPTSDMALESARNLYSGHLTQGGQVSLDAARAYVIGHLFHQAILRFSDFGYAKPHELSDERMTALIGIIDTLIESCERSTSTITDVSLRSEIENQFFDLRKKVSRNLRGTKVSH